MKRNYLDMNVILTFTTQKAWGSQEIFDLKLPINKNETDAVTFLDKKLFKRIAIKCEQYGRRKEDLYKISTASNWDVFEQVTGKKGLWSLGHNCKWYFNDEINELDEWEEWLKYEFDFGTELLQQEGV